MNRRFDLGWDALPNDGGFTPVNVSTPFGGAENDELFQAWCQERHASIELKLCLHEALELLKRVLADDGVSPRSRRKARQLILAIEASGESEPSEGAA
jgi:hypothetical protein